MTGFEFRHPAFLLLAIPLAAMAFYYYRKKIFFWKNSFPVPSRKIFGEKKSFRTATYRWLDMLRFVSMLFIIVALAGPGRSVTYSSVKNFGIDIIIALDVSPSMRAEDFQPTRLAVARNIVKDFIDKRKNDRLGMVIFSGEAFLQSPLTIELEALAEIADEVDFDSVGEDGTAIGDALALSASRLYESSSKSRVIVLITDGMNNRGVIDPETAAKACAESGIKIYAVGIGKDGRVPFTVPGLFGPARRYLENHFDGEMLKRITEMTGGRYYRAHSSVDFHQNLMEIDRLEKSEFEIKKYYDFQSGFSTWLYAGILLFLLELILRSTYYRKVP